MIILQTERQKMKTTRKKGKYLNKKAPLKMVGQKLICALFLNDKFQIIVACHLKIYKQLSGNPARGRPQASSFHLKHTWFNMPVKHICT